MVTPCHENSVGDFERNTNDEVLTNSEVGHAFVRKQFISMDKPHSSFLRPNFKLHATFISRGVFNDLFLRCATTLT